jgi:hypothetical protein
VAGGAREPAAPPPIRGTCSARVTLRVRGAGRRRRRHRRSGDSERQGALLVLVIFKMFSTPRARSRRDAERHHNILSLLIKTPSPLFYLRPDLEDSTPHSIYMQLRT